MTTTVMNTYRITREDSTIEHINAPDLVTALSALSVPDTEKPILQVFMVKQGIEVVVEDAPKEILFTAVVAENSGGSIATASSGKVHVGDNLAFRAVADTGYEFVCWKRNGLVISKTAEFVYEFTDLMVGEDTCVFTAEFKKKPITWTATVSPAAVSSEGNMVFQASGETLVGDVVSIIAIEQGDTYMFDHWERNGAVIGNAKQLNTEMTALEADETEVVYKACFIPRT